MTQTQPIYNHCIFMIEEKSYIIPQKGYSSKIKKDI